MAVGKVMSVKFPLGFMGLGGSVMTLTDVPYRQDAELDWSSQS
jgi:hypothetical protein